ncbi:MAG: arsenate reductase (glutaredoxin) [Bacteroidia bacterium]|nr:arsenate reductase (glutaredoxin) [Bacteroidia bacterium]
MKEKITILHNSRCSKSREALNMICEMGEKPEIIDYLKDTPTAKELTKIIKMIGVKPESLVRKSENIYKEKYKGKTLTDSEWIQAMVDNPILIERPIIIKGDEALIGRPPESVKRFL